MKTGKLFDIFPANPVLAFDGVMCTVYVYCMYVLNIIYFTANKFAAAHNETH